MNLLSYYQACDASLARYDLANKMLRHVNVTLEMSQRRQQKYNFRRLKKFLKSQGWVYTRPYPFKGKDQRTVSLLDIVTQNNADSFMVKHGDLSAALAKGELKIVMRDYPEEDGSLRYISAGIGANGEPSLFNQHGVEVKPNPNDLVPTVFDINVIPNKGNENESR